MFLQVKRLKKELEEILIFRFCKNIKSELMR